ncbi:transposase [Escherichia coli]|uniref:Transposase n=1 Tax=Escherichia coli TaxID=562 RepID=A0A376MQ32_ECOLX|nr:transposase [Escherichia coli]
MIIPSPVTCLSSVADGVTPSKFFGLMLMVCACSPNAWRKAVYLACVRDGKVSITRSQLAMLLDKLDWRQPKTSSRNSLTML